MTEPLPVEGAPVRIPYPCKLPQADGVLSLSHNGTMTSFRIHNDDMKLLKATAELLGITHSALCRWAVVHTVQEVYLARTGKLKQVRP